MTSQQGYDVTVTSQQRHLEMNLIDTLDMYRQICTLMVTCTRKNPLISHALQQNSVVLERLLLLFDINCCDLGTNNINISCSSFSLVLQLFFLQVVVFRGRAIACGEVWSSCSCPSLKQSKKTIFCKYHWKNCC